MKLEGKVAIVTGAASGIAKAAPAASADLDQRSHAQDRAAAR